MYNYTYDAEGNRIERTAIDTGEVTSYEWDFRNRITKVITLDSDVNIVKMVEYAYDVFDRRIGKSLDGAISEVFVYDGDHIALVFDGDGELSQRNFHGPLVDQILAIEGAESEVLWGLGDNLGTIRIVVNADGEVQNRIVYDSFGEVIEESNPGVDFRYGFTGRELDPETGLVYYRARYYDGERFISEDPIGFGGGDGNLYRYVFNSPTNFTDPSGRCVALLAPAAGLALADGPVLPFGDIAGGVLLGAGCLGIVIKDLLDDRSRTNNPPSPSPVINRGDPPSLTTPPFPPLTPPRREQPPGDFGPTPGDVPNTAPFPFPVPDEGIGPNVESFPKNSCPAIPPFLESDQSSGSDGIYIPPDPPTKKPLPRGEHGVQKPSSPYPHTQIGHRRGRNGNYRQTREWGENGELIRDIDWTDHGRPENHPNPHQHRWLPNKTGGSPRRNPEPEPLPPN